MTPREILEAFMSRTQVDGTQITFAQRASPRLDQAYVHITGPSGKLTPGKGSRIAVESTGAIAFSKDSAVPAKALGAVEGESGMLPESGRFTWRLPAQVDSARFPSADTLVNEIIKAFEAANLEW